MDNITPKTCKIASGTTLKELAEYFNLTTEQLKRYHNLYCPLEDLIGTDIPEHTKIIFVPPIEKELRKKISILNDLEHNAIKYRNQNSLRHFDFQKNYGIIQKVSVNDKEQTTAHYEICITKQGSKIEINRKEIYINQQKPDLMMEQIAEKIGNILYPIEINIAENGSIKEILNQQKILDRWLKLRPYLETYYEGCVVKEIFNALQTRIRSRSKLLYDVQSHFFFQIYFLPIFEKFNEDHQCFFDWEVSFQEMGDFPFRIGLSLDKKVSDKGYFIIQVIGNLVYTQEQDYQPNEPKGAFSFIYKLNTQNNSICSIFGEVNLLDKGMNKKLSLECYELPPNSIK